jgi:nucleotide-binding universal stress UspA family protein
MTSSYDDDRFGEKLRNAGKAREDQWAAARDAELFAKLRGRAEERAAAGRKSGTTPKVFNRILCPVDFDENALKALDLAAELASQNDAELYLLHVCPTVFVPLGGAMIDPAATEKSAEQKLTDIAAEHLAGRRHQVVVTTGDAAERVSTVQSALAIDLIVMGTHGRRAVPRFFLGSVAEQVVREAACPVLTVRPNDQSRSELAD